MIETPHQNYPNFPEGSLDAKQPEIQSKLPEIIPRNRERWWRSPYVLVGATIGLSIGLATNYLAWPQLVEILKNNPEKMVDVCGTNILYDSILTFLSGLAGMTVETIKRGTSSPDTYS